MLGRITQITHEQLRLLLCGGWTRRIRAIHIHHTWRPDHAQWRGESTVVAMRRYHVEELGWSDIAQHLTIGPDGSLWTGRSLDAPPASAVGHNGSATEGPLMIEMVGDFDAGRDAFADPQAASVYQAVAEICAAFALDSTAIRFHNELTNAKSCPGTALNLASFRPAVDQKLKAAAKRGAAAPNAHARAYAASRRATSAAAGRALEPANAEPPYDAAQAAAASDAAAASARGLFTSFGPEDIEVFRSHVVDLAHGQLSSGGCYQNSEADLDELIRRLDQWVAQRAAKPARIMFFAHGGLVSEADGLGIVRRDYEWWLANDVYPIFFVWETGFLEIFTQQREIDLGARAFITDPLLEATLGPTVGEPAWSRMKDSAFLSSADTTSTGKPGGAALFAAKLAQWFATTHPQAAQVRFHAVGHSAGSIFHCHFLPALEAAFKTANNAPQPTVSTLAFLAPAVRVDRFKELLLPRIGASIGRMSLFTMRRASELVDSVAGVYRKSLLYFVRNACEVPTHSTPILGLEESIRADADLVRLFGLGGSAGKAQVIWSPTATSEGDAASKSEKHGFFDNDWVTMNSVMRRILGIADSVPLPCPHLPEPDEDLAMPSPTSPERGFTAGADGFSRSGGAKGRRTALCIGIDDYGAQSLTGCVADSNAWATALGEWGFTVRKLANGAATRAAIMAAMTATLDGCRAGDTAVIQFAGHGTQLPDGNGDEQDGRDEAWVPHDFEQGEFVIDDDIGALFDRYRARGLQLIVFTDCCHSGTSTRLLYRAGAPELQAHSRYMEVPPAIVRRFTQKRAAGQSAPRFGAQDSTGWEIHYAACQDRQSAYEHGGHGDFTQAATKALAAALRAGTTYQGFASAIAKAFAGNAQQMPQLRAQPGIGARPLFGAVRDSASAPPVISGTASPSAPNPTHAPMRKGDADLAALAAAVDALRDEVRALSKQIADL